MAISQDILRRVVLEQHEAEQVPKVYMHRSKEKKIPIFST